MTASVLPENDSRLVEQLIPPVIEDDRWAFQRHVSLSSHKLGRAAGPERRRGRWATGLWQLADEVCNHLFVDRET